MTCALMLSFISLMLFVISVRGIVCLNVNNAQRGGKMVRSSFENCSNVLGVLPKINMKESLYVVAEESCISSFMEEKFLFHSSMYGMACSRPRTGRRVRTNRLRAIITLYHPSALRIVSGRRSRTGFSIDVSIVAQTYV